MKDKRTIILVVALVAMIGVYVWHSQRIKTPPRPTAQPMKATKLDPSRVLMKEVVKAINKYKKEKGFVPQDLEQLKGKYLDVATYNKVKKNKLEYAYVNPQAYRLTKPTTTRAPVVVAAKKPGAGTTSSTAAASKSASRTATGSEAGWTYDPAGKPDPFKPFILASRPQEAVTPKVVRQLTPLQKMALSEIQTGLKAIIWGQLGNKALVEDATGKGYVVQEGTYVGQHNGIVKRIYEDRIVVEEYKRDPVEDRLVPSEVVLKLKKGEGED
jgi:type IV pilus assembly protein PilP